MVFVITGGYLPAIFLRPSFLVFTDGPAAVSARILISLGAGMMILGTSLDSAAEVSPSQIKSPKN